MLTEQDAYSFIRRGGGSRSRVLTLLGSAMSATRSLTVGFGVPGLGYLKCKNKIESSIFLRLYVEMKLRFDNSLFFGFLILTIAQVFLTRGQIQPQN